MAELLEISVRYNCADCGDEFTIDYQDTSDIEDTVDHEDCDAICDECGCTCDVCVCADEECGECGCGEDPEEQE